MFDLLLEIVHESSTVFCQTSWQKVLPVFIFLICLGKLLGYIELLCEVMKEGLRRIITRYKAFDLHIKIRQTSVIVCYAVLQVFKKAMGKMLLHKTKGLKDFVLALDKVRVSFLY